MADEAVVGVGVGAGDTGGGDQGGGFEGGGEQAEPEVPTGDEGAEGSEGSAEGAEPAYETDPETGDFKLDEEGNKVPKAATPSDFKSTHAKLKEIDPKAADAYRKEHFSLESYKKTFETPQAATEAKELIESYGGTEGVEALSTRAEQFGKEMDSFSKGDPKFIEQLSTDDPEGFAKVGKPYLDTLAKASPETYDALLSPIITATLESSGISAGIVEAGNILDQLYGTLKAAGNTAQLPAIQQAFDALKKAYGTAENFKKLAEKSGERPLTDREKKLNEREQKLTQDQQDKYIGEVQGKVNTNTDQAIDKALGVYYKQFPKMTLDQKKDLHIGVFDYIAQQLKSNTKYGKQLRTLLDAGDAEKAAAFVATNVNKILQNGAAKTIWNRRGFGKLPNAPAGKGGTPAGTTILNSKPKYDDIWWDKDGGPTTELMYMSGNAVLRGSKRKVSWKWDRA